MKNSCGLLLGLSLTTMLISGLAIADENLDEQEATIIAREEALLAKEAREQDERLESYADKMGKKALYGATNMASALLEIPKSMINITNQTDDISYGIIGGFIEGSVNTVGRFVTGITDVITAPVLTERTISPEYIWDDFDARTVYEEDFFRLQKDFNVKQTASDVYVEAGEFYDETAQLTEKVGGGIGGFFAGLFSSEPEEIPALSPDYEDISLAAPPTTIPDDWESEQPTYEASVAYSVEPVMMTEPFVQNVNESPKHGQPIEIPVEYESVAVVSEPITLSNENQALEPVIITEPQATISEPVVSRDENINKLPKYGQPIEIPVDSEPEAVMSEPVALSDDNQALDPETATIPIYIPDDF